MYESLVLKGAADAGCAFPHSFTRNRTRESDYSPFFLRAWKVPNIVPRSCTCADLTTGKDGSSSLEGTISREVGLCSWRSVSVTGRAVCASDQLGGSG